MSKLNKNSGRSTLNDVAALARVSVSTVSRALNNDPRISARTKKTVYKAARSTNYQPNIAARALATSSLVAPPAIRNIGIIFGRYAKPNETYFSELLEGIDEVFSQNRFNMIIVTTDESPETAVRTQMVLNGETVAGVISVGQLPHGIAAQLRERIDNLVFADIEPRLVRGGDCITCDNEKGAILAVSHLLRRGRSRIALLRGPLEHHFCRALETGYRKAHRRFKKSVDAELIIEQDQINFFSSGMKACRKLLRKHLPFDGLFANDKMAIGAIRVLHEKNIKVGQDVAVVGFDDIEIAPYIEPALSTISVPKREMGRTAARMIIDKINKKSARKRRSVVLKPRLVERQSCSA